MIQDNCTYHIKLRGQFNESELNEMSPIQMTLELKETDGTSFTLCSDQSGLLGLLSYLHRLGCIILSIHRMD